MSMHSIISSLEWPLAAAFIAALIVACAAVWRLAKAGGSVKVGFFVKVDWGKK